MQMLEEGGGGWHQPGRSGWQVGFTGGGWGQEVFGSRRHDALLYRWEDARRASILFVIPCVIQVTRFASPIPHIYTYKYHYTAFIRSVPRAWPMCRQGGTSRRPTTWRWCCTSGGSTPRPTRCYGRWDVGLVSSETCDLMLHLDPSVLDAANGG